MVRSCGRHVRRFLDVRRSIATGGGVVLCPSGQYIVGRPVTADDRALDRRGQSGVDPVAGQEQPRHRRPGARPSRLSGRQRERRLRLAHDGRAPQRGGGRLGHGSRSSRQASAISSSFDWRSTASAPLETSERWTGMTPESCRARGRLRSRPGRRICDVSNTHCIVRPGRPTKASGRTGRSSQRFTVTIGDEAVPAAAAIRGASAPSGSWNRPGRPNHGTATTTASGSGSASPRTLTLSTRPPRTATRASALTRTSPPRLSMNARAGSAYISSSGVAVIPSAASRGVAREHLCKDAHERRRRAPGRCLD